MNITIDLKDDRSERVHYDTPHFPVYARKGYLSYYPNYAAASHWHDDVELIAVLSGHMNYNVNGNIVTLKEGSGIFVNSRQLHYGYSKDFSECEFICVLLHPVLLCTTREMEENFVSPVLSNADFAYRFLSSDTSWENEILASVRQIYYDKSEPASMLRIQSLFFHIWAILYEHMPPAVKQAPKPSQRLTSLRDMMGFIQNRYREKISLDEIAAAGNVCKSSCCSIFQSYLHKTPNGYLTDYRLDKSLELLRETDMSIAEIGCDTGFCSPSYYTETFRRHFGYSPAIYRKNFAQKVTPLACNCEDAKQLPSRKEYI